MPKPYRKQLTSAPLPQVTPQSAGNFLRQTAKQQENLAQETYQRSMDIYDNTFSMMANQKIAQAYKNNPNNPTGLKTELKDVEPELLKPIKNVAKRQELALKFGIMSEPFVEKATKLFRQQQKEEQQTSIFLNYDTTKQNAEDTAELLFGDPNSQATLKYGLSYWTGFDSLTKTLDMKDDLGNALLSPQQKASRINAYNNDVLSAGTRGYFDNASVQEKYNFFSKYKNKDARVITPDATSKTGFSSQSVDKFIDRTTYEQDTNYMKSWIKEYEARLKAGKKASSNEITEKLNTLERLKNKQAAFEVKTANGVKKATKNNDVINVFGFMKDVYAQVDNDILTAKEASALINPIRQSALQLVKDDKYKALPEPGWFAWEKKTALATGLRSLDEYTDEIITTEKMPEEDALILKTNMSYQFYDKFANRVSDLKSVAKSDAQVANDIVSDLKTMYNGSKLPDLVTYRRKNPKQTINTTLSDKAGKLPMTNKEGKPVGQKITSPYQEIIDRKTGQRYKVLLDENNVIKESILIR
ncbi:MAG TPA: hypothetical protein VMW66_02265 [Elusimicrobiales bacterium]|nr:hypothetical protein [Elusimicrobiales bacterium]